MYPILVAASLLILPGSATSGPATETLESPSESPRPERQEVPVETLYLELLEGFPLQVEAVLGGHLPDGCSAVESVEQRFARGARTYRLAVTSKRAATDVCAPVRPPFEIRVPLVDTPLVGGELVVESGEISTRLEVPVPDDLPVLGVPSAEESVRVCLVEPGLCFAPPPGWQRDGLMPIWESPAFLSARLGVRWHSATAGADPVGLLPPDAEIHEQTVGRMGAANGVRYAVRSARCWSGHLFVACGEGLLCELWLEAPSEPLLDAAGEDFWRLVRFAIRY